MNGKEVLIMMESVMLVFLLTSFGFTGVLSSPDQCYECRGYLDGRPPDRHHFSQCVYPRWQEDFNMLTKKTCAEKEGASGVCLIYETSIMGRKKEIVRSCPPDGVDAVDCQYKNLEQMKKLIKTKQKDVQDFEISRFQCCDDIGLCNSGRRPSIHLPTTAAALGIVAFLMKMLL